MLVNELDYLISLITNGKTYSQSTPQLTGQLSQMFFTCVALSNALQSLQFVPLKSSHPQLIPNGEL
jgi:hypothetical protein